MIKLSKGERTMQNNDIYKLVGIINIFGIYPDFVYPIFERNGKYYLQHFQSNAIDSFIETSKSKRLNMIRYLEINPNINIKKIYTVGDKPIFAFQITKDNVFFSEIDNFVNFVSNFETDDHVLSEQISEFIDDFKQKKSLIKKKENKESNQIKS